MTESDENRSGDQATPPPADPGPPATDHVAGAPVSPEPASSESPSSEPSAAASPYAAPLEPASATSSPPPVSPSPPTAAPAPAPTVPAPAPQPTAAPMAATAPRPADDDFDEGYDDYDDEIDGYGGPRWVGLATTAGAGIVGVVALQVLMAFVEAFSLKANQRFGVPDDLIHRIGYPFGSLGSTAMFFLLLAAVLLALPTILGEEVNDRQYAVVGAALRTAMVLGVIVALGSVLAVRGSLHEYSAKNVAVPGFVRVQFTSFLLATLASAALAVFGSLAALRLRDDA